MHELVSGPAFRPYGTWLDLYRIWLKYFDGTAVLLDDFFKAGSPIKSEEVQQRWTAFINEWQTQRLAVLHHWMEYPAWPGRSAWFNLSNRWHHAVLESGWILDTLMNRNLALPEIADDIAGWFALFRAWWECLNTCCPVLEQLPISAHGTAPWKRWESTLGEPTEWTAKAMSHLRNLFLRANILGRDWPIEARLGWLQWLQASVPWSIEWFSIWEAWMFLPLAES